MYAIGVPSAFSLRCESASSGPRSSDIAHRLRHRCQVQATDRAGQGHRALLLLVRRREVCRGAGRLGVHAPPRLDASRTARKSKDRARPRACGRHGPADRDGGPARAPVTIRVTKKRRTADARGRVRAAGPSHNGGSGRMPFPALRCETTDAGERRMPCSAAPRPARRAGALGSPAGERRLGARPWPPPSRRRSAGVPIDFILFAPTLLGVALFHHHTLQVALTGLAVDHALQGRCFAVRRRRGRRRLVAHLGHEWVLLANLLGLLLGFALLSKHFEASQRARVAAAAAARRLEGRLRAARDDLRAVVVPRQHRRGADRRHDRRRRVPRQGAHRLSRRHRRRVERRRLGQRRRRHDDDDDVDRRRLAAYRCSRRTSPRRSHW